MFSIKHNPRFMLIGLVPHGQDNERTIAEFEELESLVRTYGGRVFAAVTQNAARSDKATFIGSGKAQEVAEIIGKEKIDIVVINANVKPGQLYTLKKIFGRSNPDIIVWDRVDLILQIFERHAKTSEAKLQIRLANIRHLGPRIYGTGLFLSQQGGGIGARGIGETNTTLMLRHYKNEIRNIKKQLIKLTDNKFRQMDRRKRFGLATISIVGYTNSGKTTLFNRLCRENNPAEDVLFATLDSSVSKFYLHKINREAYLSDTIGFIQNLHPQLIDAFKSTLMETVNADLLLHVIDVSDPWMHDKIATVAEILHDLNIELKNQIYVFNKIDLAKKFNRADLINTYNKFHPVFINAKNGVGCDILINTIQDVLAYTAKL